MEHKVLLKLYFIKTTLKYYLSFVIYLFLNKKIEMVKVF